VKQRFDQITDDLQKYSYISNLRDRNETLFYRLVMDNIDEMGMWRAIPAWCRHRLRLFSCS
jgi:hypothetical protein